ncbi:MAG: hypothetical protein IKY44_06275 [Clostridia bacterium]|nr:hypothetical protein [Clostridia bacterium]
MTKVKGKWVLPVLLVIILVLSYFSLYGFRTQYADIVTTHISGIRGVNGGQTLTGSIGLTFYPTENDLKVTDKELDEAVEVMKARLYLNHNVSDAEFYVDYAQKTISVTYGWDGVTTMGNPSLVATRLGGKGEFSIKAGTKATDTVLLDGSHLKKAELLTVGGVTYVSYVFNSEGTKLLEQATMRYTNSTISIWIDGNCETNVKVSDVISDGVLTIQSAETKELSEAIVNTLMMDNSPISMSASTYFYDAPALQGYSNLFMLIAVGVFFVLIAVVLIAKYKLAGIAAAAAVLGYIAFFVSSATGVFSLLNTFILTPANLFAFAVTVALVIYTIVFTINSVKAKIDEGVAVKTSFREGQRSSIKNIILVNLFVLIVGFVLYGMFGFGPSFAAKLLTPFTFFLSLNGNIAVAEFAKILMFGVLGNIIFGVCIYRLMLISARGSKYFVMGGNENE